MLPLLVTRWMIWIVVYNKQVELYWYYFILQDYFTKRKASSIMRILTILCPFPILGTVKVA